MQKKPIYKIILLSHKKELQTIHQKNIMIKRKQRIVRKDKLVFFDRIYQK